MHTRPHVFGRLYSLRLPAASSEINSPDPGSENISYSSEEAGADIHQRG